MVLVKWQNISSYILSDLSYIALLVVLVADQRGIWFSILKHANPAMKAPTEFVLSHNNLQLVTLMLVYLINLIMYVHVNDVSVCI